MRAYLELLQHIYEYGINKKDRTGIGTRGVIGPQMRFDLEEGFPLVTTKKVYVKGVKHELLWFLTGDTNIRYLVDNDVHIWDNWAREKYVKESGDDTLSLEDFVSQIKKDDDFARKWGELGPVYGRQWVNWQGCDGKTYNQIQMAIDELKERPESRRILVNAWNIGDIAGLREEQRLAPPACHTQFHFIVHEDRLNCLLYQRSGDMFLGVPFNIASYAMLMHMVGQVTNLPVGELIHMIGDAHIYQNHFAQVEEQLGRQPKSLPTLELNPDVDDIFRFRYEDIQVRGYKPHPTIKAPIAI